MNILIHTWVVSNTRGSEFAITYDYIKEMSKFHHLYVIVNSCSYKLDDTSEFSDIKIDNCDFIFVKPDIILRMLRAFEKFPDPIKGWVKYIYWKAWEKRVYRTVKKQYMDTIDVIHYLGPGGNHEAGYLWKIDKPYIWGPTNGFFNIPKCVLQHYVANRGIFHIKNMLNSISVYTDIRRKKAYKKADVVIAGMKWDAEFIERKFKVNKLLYYPENTIHLYEKDVLSEEYIFRKYSKVVKREEKITVIWCGSLTPRKMPNLLLDVISELKNSNSFSFRMIGGGELEEYIRLQSESLIKIGVDIKVLGQMPRDDVLDYYRNAHLHILTSASEGNPTVISEAIENCVPSVALHVCGMADTVTNENGTSIPVNNYKQIVRDMAKALDDYAESPDLILKKALQLRCDSLRYTLDKKNAFFNSVYDYALRHHSELR